MFCVRFKTGFTPDRSTVIVQERPVLYKASSEKGSEMF